MIPVRIKANLRDDFVIKQMNLYNEPHEKSKQRHYKGVTGHIKKLKLGILNNLSIIE